MQISIKFKRLLNKNHKIRGRKLMETDLISRIHEIDENHDENHFNKLIAIEIFLNYRSVDYFIPNRMCIS